MAATSIGRRFQIAFKAAVYLGLSCLAQRCSASADLPVYLTQAANINDYSVFATSGWDGNWYVGYNTCWIVRLPAPPKGNYARAFIGAKLGRMKVLPPTTRPPEFRPIAGEIFMAVASTPAWTSGRHVRLTNTEPIPLEGHPEIPFEGPGEAQWFWAEVPLDRIQWDRENYLALWSPTPELVQASSAPILAAAIGGKNSDTWILHNSRGAPPAKPQSLPGTPISFFLPAIAMKFIPAGPGRPLEVRAAAWQPGTASHQAPVISAAVDGSSIERVWLAYREPIRRGNVVRDAWHPFGRPLWKPPYQFDVDQTRLPKGQVQLRVMAENVWGDRAGSDPFTVEVSTYAVSQ